MGNGGWSYTLNNINPQQSKQVDLQVRSGVIKDSTGFEGRTPCAVPGIIPAGKQCYKLKWFVVLHADAKQHQTGTYKLFGTPYRKEGGRRGTWKTVTNSKGAIVYQLNNEKETPFIFYNWTKTYCCLQMHRAIY